MMCKYYLSDVLIPEKKADSTMARIIFPVEGNKKNRTYYLKFSDK